MFDWFDKTFRRREGKIGADMNKVIPFSELKADQEPEKSAETYYRLGLTNDNRVSFQMGYSEIIMNREGCQQVIDQITFFMNQLRENENIMNQPPEAE